MEAYVIVKCIVCGSDSRLSRFNGRNWIPMNSQKDFEDQHQHIELFEEEIKRRELMEDSELVHLEYVGPLFKVFMSDGDGNAIETHTNGYTWLHDHSLFENCYVSPQISGPPYVPERERSSINEFTRSAFFCGE